MTDGESIASKLNSVMAKCTEYAIGVKNPVLVLHGIVRLCGDIKTRAEGAGVAANVKLSLALEVQHLSYLT